MESPLGGWGSLAGRPRAARDRLAAVFGDSIALSGAAGSRAGLTGCNRIPAAAGSGRLCPSRVARTELPKQSCPDGVAQAAGESPRRQPSRNAVGCGPLRFRRRILSEGAAYNEIIPRRSGGHSQNKQRPPMHTDASAAVRFLQPGYSMSPLSFSSSSISVPRTFFRAILSISFSAKERGASLMGFLSMA